MNWKYRRKKRAFGVLLCTVLIVYLILGYEIYKGGKFGNDLNRYKVFFEENIGKPINEMTGDDGNLEGTYWVFATVIVFFGLFAYIFYAEHCDRMEAMWVTENYRDAIDQVMYVKRLSGDKYRFSINYLNCYNKMIDVGWNDERYQWLSERAEEHSEKVRIIELAEEREKAEFKAAAEARKNEEKEARRKATTPVKTKILDGGTSSTTTQASGVGRAIVGGIIAGPTGAIVGAATAGKKTTEHNYTVFKVWYEDGHTDVEKVEHGTKKYDQYIRLIED